MLSFAASTIEQYAQVQRVQAGLASGDAGQVPRASDVDTEPLGDSIKSIKLPGPSERQRLYKDAVASLGLEGHPDLDGANGVDEFGVRVNQTGPVDEFDSLSVAEGIVATQHNDSLSPWVSHARGSHYRGQIRIHALATVPKTAPGFDHKWSSLRSVMHTIGHEIGHKHGTLTEAEADRFGTIFMELSR